MYASWHANVNVMSAQQPPTQWHMPLASLLSCASLTLATHRTDAATTFSYCITFTLAATTTTITTAAVESPFTVILLCASLRLPLLCSISCVEDSSQANAGVTAMSVIQQQQQLSRNWMLVRDCHSKRSLVVRALQQQRIILSMCSHIAPLSAYAVMFIICTNFFILFPLCFASIFDFHFLILFIYFFIHLFLLYPD